MRRTAPVTLDLPSVYHLNSARQQHNAPTDLPPPHSHPQKGACAAASEGPLSRPNVTREKPHMQSVTHRKNVSGGRRAPSSVLFSVLICASACGCESSRPHPLIRNHYRPPPPPPTHTAPEEVHEWGTSFPDTLCTRHRAPLAPDHARDGEPPCLHLTGTAISGARLIAFPSYQTSPYCVAAHCCDYPCSCGQPAARVVVWHVHNRPCY